MREREPVGLRVGADIGQPQALRLVDQHAEHAVSARQLTDDAGACPHRCRR